VDVQAAIVSAQSGDTVRVPAGNCTWDSQLIITKGIYLIGAGQGNTNITGAYVGTGNAPNATQYLVVYNPVSPSLDEPFRLSGFSWTIADNCAWLMLTHSSTTIALTKIRIDHNTLVSGATSGTRGTAIYVVGHIYGVVDNNNLTYYWAFTTVIRPGGGVSTWQNFTFDYGTANNLYLEDNILTMATGGHSCAIGGRYCSRYNTYYASNGVFPLFDIHGNQPPGQWAPAGAELYGNTLNMTGNNGVRIFDARGGKVLAYNNNINTTDGVNQQIRDEYSDLLQDPSANLISGQPMYPSECYSWNNTRNGTTQISTTVGSTIDYGGEIRIVPRANFNFWDYTASFDGSSGMGVGLLSARPTTCTVGVGYWATDESKLYRCTATNVWTFYYTPYTYPHPFRTDCVSYPSLCDSVAPPPDTTPPAAPTGLTVQ
jgi:hypothetical protein